MPKIHSLFCVALLACMPTWTLKAQSVSWTNCAESVSASSYVEFSDWPLNSGVAHMRLEGTSSEGSVDISISPDGSSCDFSPQDFFDNRPPEMQRFAIRSPMTDATATVALRRYRHRVTVYVNGEPAVSMRDCWSSPISLFADASAPPCAETSYRQELGVFSFSDAFMVDENDKSALQNWEVVSGEWSLHAVTGRTICATANASLKGYPTPAHSPNFYSLSGFGKCAAIISGEPFLSHYAVRASVRHNAGVNGLVFLVSEDLKGFAFTVETDPDDNSLIFALRRDVTLGKEMGTVVRAVKAKLSPGQWYMLEARLAEDSIDCLVDGIVIIRHKTQLRPGGFFGLLSDTNQPLEAGFDDVSAETYTDLDIASREDERYFRQATVAKAFNYFGATSDEPPAITIRPHLTKEGASALVAIGLRSVFSNAFPIFMASAKRKNNEIVFELSERASATNEPSLIDAVTLPITESEKLGYAPELTLDGREDGVIALRIGNRAIMLDVAESAPVGLAGYAISGGAELEAPPKIVRHKSIYTDRFEKNKCFVTDPYMRHWASTAGQWLTFTNGTARYKDLILNRVSLSLPVIDDIELNFAFADGRDEGVLVLSTTNGTLSISQRETTNSCRQLYSWHYPAAQLKEGTLSVTNRVTLRLDGGRFLFTSATGAVFRCALAPDSGAKNLIFKRAPAAYMGHISVIREPVLDCLFSESLHDWSINGGSWEIINRFQCQPKWSHMNGENPDSLAAIWSKYEISGDFSVTFVAGMRHGWYERIGDMNLTVCNKIRSPSDGYTLTVTEWDPNESQHHSTLRKNGRVIARTDAYTAPRRRWGNVRKAYEPLLAKGRDVHGAWYTIQLNRLNDKLTFIFDNKKIFEAIDPEPLNSGSFGIWTYRNSMVTARVRITADSIRPRTFDFAEIPPETMKSAQTSSESPLGDTESCRTPTNGDMPLFFNSLPTEFIRPGLWHPSDDVSFPHVSFTSEEGHSVMTVSSTHGSGSFLVTPDERVQRVRGDKLAGITFEVARSIDALFNFEYSYDDAKDPRLFTHVICGSTNRLGPRIIASASPVPQPTPQGKQKIWTPITVWFPITGEHPKNHVINIDGFGNLQPSQVQQGLCGNPPGAWYAIRNMRPIFCGAPVPDNRSENTKAFADDLKEALENGKGGQINSFKIAGSGEQIQWILPPVGDPGLLATFEDLPKYMIKIESTLPWPNPLLCVSNVTVNGKIARLAALENNALIIPLERPFCPESSPAIKVSFLTTEGRRFTQMLTPKEFNGASSPRPPTLTRLEFPPELDARYENFESRSHYLELQDSNINIDQRRGKHKRQEVSRSTAFGDIKQGTFWHVYNNGERRNSLFFSIFKYDFITQPFVQFRYRGDEMALINPSVFACQYEFCHSELPESRLNAATLDDNWHTALFKISDASLKINPRNAFGSPLSCPLSFAPASFAGRSGNQTGLYSYFDIDEIAYGPAIGPKNKDSFAFKAEYDAPDGITEAAYAIMPGLEPCVNRTPDEIASLDWLQFDPSTNVMIRPDISALPDGPYHLLLRAKSGEAALPPADMPFLLDTIPPETSVKTLDSSLFDGQNLLQIDINGGDGAPPSLLGTSVSSSNVTLNLKYERAAYVEYKANTLQLSLNWPFLLKSEVQAAKDGDTLKMLIEGIADGAGNIAAPLICPIKIDYASDKTPPSIVKLDKFAFHEMKWKTPRAFFHEIGKNVALAVIARKPAEDKTLEEYVKLSVFNHAQAKDETTRSATTQLLTPICYAHTNSWMLMRTAIPENTAQPDEGSLLFTVKFTLAALGNVGEGEQKFGKDIEVALPVMTSSNSSPAACHGSFDFHPGEWRDIAFDMKAILSNLAVTNDATWCLRKIKLILPPEKDAAICIASIAILGDWQEDNALRCTAYDASGIEGLCLDGKFYSEEMVISPAKVPREGTTPEARFFRAVTIRDRAGNLTQPVMLPLPPQRVPHGSQKQVTK